MAREAVTTEESGWRIWPIQPPIAQGIALRWMPRASSRVYRLSMANPEIKSLPGSSARVRATLIVVGEKGGSTRRNQWVGSVARHVVQHAPCPVLVVPTSVLGELVHQTKEGPMDL